MLGITGTAAVAANQQFAPIEQALQHVSARMLQRRRYRFKGLEALDMVINHGVEHRLPTLQVRCSALIGRSGDQMY